MKTLQQCHTRKAPRSPASAELTCTHSHAMLHPCAPADTLAHSFSSARRAAVGPRRWRSSARSRSDAGCGQRLSPRTPPPPPPAAAAASSLPRWPHTPSTPAQGRCQWTAGKSLAQSSACGCAAAVGRRPHHRSNKGSFEHAVAPSSGRAARCWLPGAVSAALKAK